LGFPLVTVLHLLRLASDLRASVAFSSPRASLDNETVEHNSTFPHFYDPAKIYSRLAYLFELIRGAGAGVGVVSQSF
jgi:hypothetical protein